MVLSIDSCCRPVICRHCCFRKLRLFRGLDNFHFLLGTDVFEVQKSFAVWSLKSYSDFKKRKMYYSAVPPNGTPAAIGQEKQPNIYVPAPSPFGPAPAGYAPAQPTGLPAGLAAAAPRYTAGPQAYAVVSTPGHHPGFGAISPAYTSLPYAGLTTIPTSSHAYISTGQFPTMGYHQAALTPRSAPPSHFSTPVQAGAPLIAAGYTPVPGGAIPQQAAARNYPPFGTMTAFPAAAGAYSVPTATGTAPGPYHTPAPYVPPF